MDDESLVFPRSSRAVTLIMQPLRLSMYGMPKRYAGEQLEMWRGHLEFVRADGGKSPVVVQATQSFASQIAWRLTFGPATALFPGAALVVAGFGSALMALSRTNAIVAEVALFLALLALGATLVRHPRVQPRNELALTAGLCSPALLLYSAEIATDIWIPSDWFIVAGTAVAAAGTGVLSLAASPVSIVDDMRGRTWGFGLAALGAGLIAVAEIEWLLRWEGLMLFVPKALTAAATLAIAFTAWRIREIPQDPEQPFDVSSEIRP